MALEIPATLRKLLYELGYTWPEADEDKLEQLGKYWSEFGKDLERIIADAEAAAAKVWNNNYGKDVDSFQNAWEHPDEAIAVLKDSAQGAQTIGAVATIVAALILGLKINVIVQLTILAVEIAQAIATAPETAGLSLLEIPIFKMITGAILDHLIDMVIEKIIDG